MAFWQLLYFRKKAYRRKVNQEKYARNTHRTNIHRKVKQKSRATSGIFINTLAIPFTGGLSAPNVVLHARNRSIAKQKHKILTDVWKERYPNSRVPGTKPPEASAGFWRRARSSLKSFCCCIVSTAVDDTGSFIDTDYGESDNDTSSLTEQGRDAVDDDVDEKKRNGSDVNQTRPTTTKRKSTKEKKSTSGAIKENASAKEKKASSKTAVGWPEKTTSSRVPSDDKETSAKDKDTSIATRNATKTEANPTPTSADSRRNSGDDDPDTALDVIAAVDAIAAADTDFTAAADLAFSPTLAAGDVGPASPTPESVDEAPEDGSSDVASDSEQTGDDGNDGAEAQLSARQ